MPTLNGATKGSTLDKTVYRDYRLRDVPPDAARTYRRYAYTDSGVSPLAVPGQSECLVVDDSDEHDEEGHLIEDSLTRTRMVEKRLLKKLPLIRAEIAPLALRRP